MLAAFLPVLLLLVLGGWQRVHAQVACAAIIISETPCDVGACEPMERCTQAIGFDACTCVPIIDCNDANAEQCLIGICPQGQECIEGETGEVAVCRCIDPSTPTPPPSPTPSTPFPTPSSSEGEGGGGLETWQIATIIGFSIIGLMLLCGICCSVCSSCGCLPSPLTSNEPSLSYERNRTYIVASKLDGNNNRSSSLYRSVALPPVPSMMSGRGKGRPEGTVV